MLASNYATLIMGADLMSALMATAEERQRGSTLWIRPPLYQRGSTLTINALERRWLMAFGEQWDLWPLKSIDKYLTPAPYRVCTSDGLVELGHSPSENALEWARKCGPASGNPWMTFLLRHCTEEWNRIFDQEVERQVQMSWRGGRSRSTTAPSERWQEWEVLLASLCMGAWQGKEREWMRVWQLQGKTTLGGAWSAESGRKWAIHAMSPLYSLDESAFFDDVTQYYQSIGGTARSLHISEWQLDGARCPRVLLDSYRGVVGIETAWIMDDPREHFVRTNQGPHVRSIHAKAQLPLSNAERLPSLWIPSHFGKKQSQGHDVVWAMNVAIRAQGALDAVLWVQHDEGSKLAFIEKDSVAALEDVLVQNYRIPRSELALNGSLNFETRLWSLIDDVDRSTRIPSQPRMAILRTPETARDLFDEGFPVANIQDWGAWPDTDGDLVSRFERLARLWDSRS